ncbi:hypothetical protein [Bacillus sp. JJ1562]|uniref:hypothetical protein n=1 Tax=Bacillus sp. JJ1562 TaxID=3122960 RepID=UPI003002126F
MVDRFGTWRLSAQYRFGGRVRVGAIEETGSGCYVNLVTPASLATPFIIFQKL